MDTFSCTCRGENSNCFRCFGTGLVEKPLPGVGRPHRNLAEAAAAAAAAGKNESTKQDRAPRARRKKKAQLNTYVAQLPIYIKCPDCGEVVRHLNKHKRLRHDATVNAEVRRTVTLTKCQKCGVLVKNLSKHQKKAHGNGSEDSRVAAKKKSKPIQGTTQVENLTSFAVRETRERDAKHGWGGAFRDHGKFGSYPSYDDMDDESFA